MAQEFQLLRQDGMIRLQQPANVLPAKVVAHTRPEEVGQVHCRSSELGQLQIQHGHGLGFPKILNYLYNFYYLTFFILEPEQEVVAVCVVVDQARNSVGWRANEAILSPLLAGGGEYFGSENKYSVSNMN